MLIYMQVKAARAHGGEKICPPPSEQRVSPSEAGQRAEANRLPTGFAANRLRRSAGFSARQQRSRRWRASQ